MADAAKAKGLRTGETRPAAGAIWIIFFPSAASSRAAIIGNALSRDAGVSSPLRQREAVAARGLEHRLRFDGRELHHADGTAIRWDAFWELTVKNVLRPPVFEGTDHRLSHQP